MVTGSPRYNDSGAVLLIDYDPTMSLDDLDRDEYMYLLPDQTLLAGAAKLASGFGYALEVLDINRDG